MVAPCCSSTVQSGRWMPLSCTSLLNQSTLNISLHITPTLTNTYLTYVQKGFTYPCYQNKGTATSILCWYSSSQLVQTQSKCIRGHWMIKYEGWNFNFGNAAVTFDTAHLQSSYFHRPSMCSPKLCRTRSQRWGSRMMPLAAPVLLMVRTERSTAEGLNPPCNCPIR